ncbi:filamentous hemagglutinin N-terminal domain-containing protein [Salmonella enterica subsp. enterica serovar Anecho]|uniref:Filamentous hemagglutinin N-terminal domain-containing protein n=1 Tax=Salmonella enterica TaxID=28901 RepID=A0A743IQV8_SALER|nr:filamentous hemagglutinin N-terminal domain-containing protein [Salmonella enterica subsp. enterica serovar Agoueve]ECD2771146.1 filamentous hemagglutinin N-terminal domain-containing protein [Salmonella enterica subsp. enterica serovar Anecho]HAF1888050.1 filamentous hemagglutinin N-terminal domain-containing protein [Salmonella enterica]ECV9875123.1 filamentous hemagglutinin N-terminal domain-containing protein [Salmonella enterica subsp. enterica serovar Anecho]EDQ6203453.1 filamentous he
MNKIYKLKYDRRRQQLVAVSELTTGAGKEATGQVCGLSDISSFRKLLGTLTPLAFLTGLIVSLLPGMALANPSLPTGGQIVAGQGSISTSGNQMTVNQNTQGMVTNWNSFDIGKNHTVQFVQPGSSAVALNRVTGGHESQILGTLKANGQVMLINPAGVMFGKGAKVNTAGMVASTKNISNEDFMAGRYTFSGGSQPGAEIVNQGSLTTTKGGYIVLAADRVRNQGEIRTPGGRVVLAAADRVTLQLDNTGLTAVSVNGSVVNALAENRGLISATNGQVYLTARGKDMLLNTVVNNSGTVEAKGLSERGGEIVLDGGDSGVVSQSGMLLADSDSGRGGKITLEGQNIHLAGGSLISATGETGGGEVYVGGGWQGKDSSIRHASKVVMDKTAVIDVSAKARGQGGTAVLWSDDYTNFRGTILARGGLQGGDGGRVETSSHHNLQAFGDVDASAVKGNAGEWLLDPFDITVVSGSTDTDVNEGSGNDGIFTPDTGTSQVSNGTINNRLNSGTNVTIKTAKENSGSNQWGNITVNADISHTATNNVSLTLEADGNINITNHSITSTTGKLDVNLLGAGSHDGTITLNNATVSSNGGNITLGQLNAGSDGTTSGLAVSITNSTLNATSAGNISITANNGTTLGNGTLSGNEVSVSASSGTGDALVINLSSNLTAAGNLTVSGDTSATGNKYGIHTSDSQFTAGDTLNMTAEAAGGTDGAFKASDINVSAQNAVMKGTSGGAGGTGVWLTGNVTNTRDGGNLTITGTTTGSGNSIGVNVLANLTANGTGNLNITGKGAQGVGVKVDGKTLTGGNVTVTGTSGNSNGKGLEVKGGTLNATGGNIALTGCMTGRNGGFGAHIYSGSSFTARDNITITGYAMDGTNGGLNLNGGTFNATSTVLNGTSQNNNLGAKVGGVITVSQGNLSLSGTANRVNSAPNVTGVVSDGTLSITVSSGTLNVTGKVNDTANNPTSASTTRGLSLVNTTLNATEVSLSGEVAGGRDGTGASLTNTTINATTGNATLNATVANGNALVVSGGNITAGKDISLTGTAKAGSGYGVSLTNGNMTASSGNISVNGTGFDSNRGALNVNGGNFSAQNTVLEGTAGRNNKGTVLNGNINVTQGNLAVTGTVTQTANSLDNNQFTGLLASGNITVSQGSLNLTGHITGKSGLNAKAVNLTNLNISASNASITGVNQRNGTGFILSNVNLTGDIEKGANTTFSSAGSDSSVTNVIGSGVLNATTTDVLMRAGIENDTQISASGMALGGSGDNWNQNYTSSKGGGWIFDGATVSKTGNISLQGVGFVNSSVTAGKDLTINNGDDSLTVQNTTLNATTISLSGGSISLTGNSSVNAVNDITLNAPKGGVNINGQSNVNTVNISSESGNISIEGNGAGFNRDGVLISNALLNASKGGITVTGVADGADYRLRGGVKFTDSVNLTSQSNTINGTHQRGNAGRVNFAGVVINPGNYHFKGNTTINAESDDYAGLAFSSSVPRTYITFSDGNFVIDAKNNSTAFNSIGGISIDNWEGTQAKIIITTLNGTLNISGQARNREGINSVSSSFSINPNDGSGYHGYVFKGDGDVNVKGVSDSSNGVDMRFFDNTGVTGNFTITGESNTGNGVAVPKFGEISLVNTTITGSSKSGAGILMNASDKQIKKIDLNGNTLTGTSVSGAGIKINGNNVSIANGSLNGTSQGNGAGVELTGGNNYTVSHVTVTGQSAGGNAVGVNGNLTLNDSTLSGNTANGSGVSVSGNVNSTNTTISGGATGSGNGVSLGGNASITDGTVTGNAVDGNGVSVSGNVNTTNTTISGGASGSGNGVSLDGNASITDGTVTGNAVDGNGVSVSGNVNTTNTTVTGNATGTGSGVDLAGNVTGGTVNGNATDGTGVNVSGDSTLTDVTVNGNTTSGTGVDVNANLTNQGSTTVNGNATGTGSGVDLVGNVAGGTVNGNATDGTGVNVSGNSTLTDVTVNGNTTSGTGVDISGNLTNKDNTTITGNSGSGAGVGLNGTVTGGSLAGNSVSGPGLHVTGNSTLNGVDVTASSQSGPGTQMDGMLSVSGGTTLNGEEQKDSAELRRQVYERQQQLSRSDTVRDAYRTSGYRVEEKPVSVEICTDGECRALETGYADAPKAR